MGGPTGYTRANISLPRELKARMDAFKTVNWSAVAAESFERELLAIESKKEVGTMEDVITRMKAAAALETNEEFQAGFEAGQAWAREDATPKVLRRIAAYIERLTTERIRWWEVESADRFVTAAWPETVEDHSRCRVFWEATLGDASHRIDDPDFFRGFAQGSLDVWKAVRDRL